MRRSILPVVALASLAVLSCQRPDLAKKELKTEQKICQQLSEVAKALEQVAALQPTSTVGQARSADLALGTALAALETSKQDLENLRLQAFQKQLKSFKGEVARVTNDKKLTLEQAATDLKTKAQPVITARRQLSAAVNCEAPAAKP
jgi:hypothetical protein